METLNNFWPFRYLKGVLIFILFQTANLNCGGQPSHIGPMLLSPYLVVDTKTMSSYGYLNVHLTKGRDGCIAVILKNYQCIPAIAHLSDFWTISRVIPSARAQVFNFLPPPACKTNWPLAKTNSTVGGLCFTTNKSLIFYFSLI